MSYFTQFRDSVERAVGIDTGANAATTIGNAVSDALKQLPGAPGLGQTPPADPSMLKHPDDAKALAAAASSRNNQLLMIAVAGVALILVWKGGRK